MKKTEAIFNASYKKYVVIRATTTNLSVLLVTAKLSDQIVLLAITIKIIITTYLSRQNLPKSSVHRAVVKVLSNNPSAKLIYKTVGRSVTIVISDDPSALALMSDEK